MLSSLELTDREGKSRVRDMVYGIIVLDNKQTEGRNRRRGREEKRREEELRRLDGPNDPTLAVDPHILLRK